MGPKPGSFEINLIKELGFDTNLNAFKLDISENEITKLIDIDGYKYEVPIFLINQH